MKLKNTLKYNRTLGIVVLILIIPLTLFLKANLSLSAKKGDLKDVYADSMKSEVLSCADSMALFCSAAEKAGADVTEAKAAAEAFADAAKDPFAVAEAAGRVFPLLKQTNDLLRNEGSATALTGQYYNAVGASLKRLADHGDYAGARNGYEFVRTHPIAGQITLRAKEATDFAALFERYGADFDLPVTPEEPEFLSGLASLLSAAFGAVSSVVGWIFGAIGWVFSRGKGIAGVIIVAVLISAASKSKPGK